MKECFLEVRVTNDDAVASTRSSGSRSAARSTATTRTASPRTRWLCRSEVLRDISPGIHGQMGKDSRSFASRPRETLEEVHLARKEREGQIPRGVLAGWTRDEAECAARFADREGVAEGERRRDADRLLHVNRRDPGGDRALPKGAEPHYVKHGDLSESSRRSSRGGRRRPSSKGRGRLSLLDVAETFEAMTQAKGKGSNALKKERPEGAPPQGRPETEAKYIVKILTKEMRIGLVDGLVEEAVAASA